MNKVGVKPKAKVIASKGRVKLRLVRTAQKVSGGRELKAKGSLGATGEATSSQQLLALGRTGSGERTSTQVTAEVLAARQREISISEFFTKNRHLLGFDNPQKALLTAVKEAVDNSLDACEEARILPQIKIEIDQLAEDRFRIVVEDNGPGIVKKQIPKIFGKLLYGSKFHTRMQQRGQQGIGISAAALYGQLTTAQPVRITSRVSPLKPAHYYEIQIDTLKNAPVVLAERDVPVDGLEHGTRVELELEGVYKKGRRSVDEYVALTALANPHAEIIYRPPVTSSDAAPQIIRYERAVSELPPAPRAIRPHPYGVELGMLINMLKETKAHTLAGALRSDFSRVSQNVALEICRLAGVDPESNPRHLEVAEVERIFRAIPQVKIIAPPSDCLSPIGELAILEGLKKHLPHQADFYASLTRPPAVYRGNPFQVEVGLAYGGQLPKDETIDLLRFANRVPLVYQQSACAITKAAMTVDWKNYGLEQPKGALPVGPMVLFVHMASVWVPFTSESKEAIAHYPEILRELRLAMQEVGRRLAAFLRGKRREAEAERRRSYIEKFIPHIAGALAEILALKKKEQQRIATCLEDLLERSRK